MERALGLLPSSRFVLTAAFDGDRGGYPLKWVQRVSVTPACIAVAIPKGHPTVPLVRDARAFAICLIGDDDRRTYRRFELAASAARDPDGSTALLDPFDALAVEEGETGSPLIVSAQASFDCVLRSHVDFDADHELYVGEVVGARVG